MDRPNIVFVVLDAVRADHVGSYGYERDTTPNLDAIAAEGIRYANAFSPSVWTPTVHGAIFTGRYPSHNGVHGTTLGIPDDYETLPEALRSAGYRTFAASAGAHIRRDRGYDRGIDEYVETRRISPDLGFIRKVLSDRSFAKQVGFSLRSGPDDKTRYKLDRLQRFVRESVADEEPFFGFVNAKTAHSPFNPPRPYKGTFLDDFERPRWEVLERLLGALGRRTQSVAGQDDEKLARIAHSGGDEVLAGDLELTAEEWDVIEAWYDGAIRYLDERIGALVESLREVGVYDDTLLVVTSDHGDNFGDHGLTGHAFCLYDSLLHVPLVVSPPEGGDGTVVDDQVSLVDLHPTFLAAAEVEPPDYDLTTSLLPPEGPFHDYTFAEYAGYEGPKTRLERKYPGLETGHLARTLQAVRSDERKLIVDSAGEAELYAWREDRAERDDLSSDEPDAVAELRTVLDGTLGELRVDEPMEEPDDPDLRQQLEDLGYR